MHNINTRASSTTLEYPTDSLLFNDSFTRTKVMLVRTAGWLWMANWKDSEGSGCVTAFYVRDHGGKPRKYLIHDISCPSKDSKAGRRTNEARILFTRLRFESPRASCIRTLLRWGPSACHSQPHTMYKWFEKRVAGENTVSTDAKAWSLLATARQIRNIPLSMVYTT